MFGQPKRDACRSQVVVIAGTEVCWGFALQECARYGPVRNDDRVVLVDAEPHPALFRVIGVVAEYQRVLDARLWNPIGLEKEVANEMVRNDEPLLDAA